MDAGRVLTRGGVVLDVVAQVFKKNGLVCYDPQGEAFDPNHHNAVFEVKDSMRPEGTVASVLKVRGV